MGKYVDGFVLVVPKDKAPEYRKMAEMGRDAWIKAGALQYFECKSEDMKPQEMGEDKTRTFPETVGATSEEDVWFSFIVFESREHRDAVNAIVMKVMGEQMSQFENMPMPVDMNRMLYGGFQVEVEG